MSAPLEHHSRSDLCTTRPRYRQGRKLTSVKVYTISQESKCLLLQGVPSVASTADILKACASYGPVEKWSVLEDYPREEFTQVLLVKYKQLRNARVAKRKLDDSSLYGGVLHVCYAPEEETVQDTRDKLQQRRQEVARQIRKLAAQSTTSKQTPKATQQMQSEGDLLPNESGEQCEQKDHSENKDIDIDNRIPAITQPPPPPPPLSQSNDPDNQPSGSSTQPAFNNDQSTQPHPPIMLPFPPQSHPTFRHQGPFPPRPRGHFPPPARQPPFATAPHRNPPDFSGAPHLQWHMNNYNPRIQYPSQIPEEQLDMRESGGSSGDLSNKHNFRTQSGKSGKSSVSRPDSDADINEMDNDQLVSSNTYNDRNKINMNSKTPNNAMGASNSVLIKPNTTINDKQMKSKFVPRQTKRRTVIPETLLQNITSSVQEKGGGDNTVLVSSRDAKLESRGVSDNGKPRGVKRKADPVNEKLRADAFILGQRKAGPKLLADEEREAFEDREAVLAEPSVDKTVQGIRAKVLEFSAKALPPQLKRAKKQTKSVSKEDNKTNK